MSKEKSIKDIITSLKDSFGGFPTKTDFEEQMNNFRRGKEESIKVTMNRYEYIINKLYKDEQDLGKTRELKCKEMVKKVAMAEALEHLERAEMTHNELDFSYQDRLKFLSREEEILMKRHKPQINSVNGPTSYPLEQCIHYEADCESNSDEYHSSDEYSQEEPEQIDPPVHKDAAPQTINNVNIENPEPEDEITNSYETPEDPEYPSDTLPPEVCLNSLMEENAFLREELAAMKERYENRQDTNNARPMSPSLNSLTREYERIRNRRAYEQQLPPRFIGINDQCYKRTPHGNQKPHYDYPNEDEETLEAHLEDEVDENDYDVEDYLEQPVTNEMVVNALMYEISQLIRELELKEILYLIERN